jgi:cobalt-precorrin-6B (C15)-methyltransferase
MKWTSKSYGIPDELFIRDKVPMTKSGIRSLTLSKLVLESTSRVLDIGCGTGSVSVECGIICDQGHITAIDADPLAVELTQKNCAHFEVDHVTIIQGNAPQDLPKQPFDRIFLGGGSKHIGPIIQYVNDTLCNDGIFVANTILLESTYLILKALEVHDFKQIECMQVNISKSEHAGYMLLAHNPIFIISAKK